MKYTKEFKLECIRKYKSGQKINDPGGCKHKTFFSKVRVWTKIYESLGEDGLEHKSHKRTWQDKMKMINRVLEGESISSVACSNGIYESMLSKWYKIYKENGINGLKLDGRGRSTKMRKKTINPNKPKTKEELEKENEYLRAENEYLKKLNALVQKKKDQQLKKK